MSELDLRASDADRERAAERLRGATAEGRLSAEELEERLERALAARTEGELSVLVADLPPAEPSPAPRPARGFALQGRGRFIAVSILLVAIWALTGAGYFWPVWPILGWGLFAFGPGSWMPGTLARPCHRGSSSRAYSTARSRS